MSNFAPQSYHDFIGFRVEKEVLERAFHDTYSLEMKDIFSDLDLALGTYRHAVSATIPQITRVAWNLTRLESYRKWREERRGGSSAVFVVAALLMVVGALIAFACDNQPIGKGFALAAVLILAAWVVSKVGFGHGPATNGLRRTNALKVARWLRKNSSRCVQ